MVQDNGSPRGFKDTPIANLQDEALGLKEYADGLAEFIRGCDTPMTIALQGDWGSGKTSLMHLIREQLPATNIMKVWFNTWQYAQFSMDNTLAISLISRFIDQVTSGQNNTTGQKVKQAVSTVAKFMYAGTVKGIAATTGFDTADALEALSRDKGEDIAATLTRLKEELETFVRERADVERIVVFIDDLDRLIPAKAVELLENLKIFLDIEKCVYVLAVDYQVVVQGLKARFGVGEADLKGKSFFDKIIQVPFNMPVTRYDANVYFQSLLRRLSASSGMACNPNVTVEHYIQLAAKSVGFNPRTMKRLFNSLLLLQIVAEKKGVFRDLGSVSPHEISRILFAILCMQQAFPEVYMLLSAGNLPISERKMEEYCDEKYWEESGVLKDMQVEWPYAKLADFMESLCTALHLDGAPKFGKGSLQKTEIDTFRTILTFSGVVGTESTPAQAPKKMDRKRFLDSLGSEEDLKFFEEVLLFLDEHGRQPVWGERGFSIRNKDGKSVAQCYPSDVTRKSGFDFSHITPEQTDCVIAALREKGIEKRTFGIGDGSGKLTAAEFVRIIGPLL